MAQMHKPRNSQLGVPWASVRCYIAGKAVSRGCHAVARTQRRMKTIVICNPDGRI